MLCIFALIIIDWLLRSLYLIQLLSQPPCLSVCLVPRWVSPPVPPRLCPNRIGPTRLWQHSFVPTRLCPHTFVPTHVCARTRLCPHTFLPRHVCAQTRCAQMHLCPDIIEPTRLSPCMTVPREACAQTHLCPNTNYCGQTRSCPWSIIIL